MADLTEDALNQVIKNLQAYTMLTGEAIKLTPTHLYMIPYLDESAEEFERRCIVAKHIADAMMKENGK